MATLKLIKLCPMLVTSKLEVQHQILQLLVDSVMVSDQERSLANQTIEKVARVSESFSNSILSKIEEAILSGNYNLSTCINFIRIIGNVSSDSQSVSSFFETVKRLIAGLNHSNQELLPHLLRALLRVVIRSPIIV